MGGYPTVKLLKNNQITVMMVMLILGLQKHDDDDDSDTRVWPVLLWHMR